jgi:hypothetical protein
VVAEELVQLDQVRAVLFEPGGEALVQFGSRGLGESVVGGVAYQQVAEAESVLGREPGLVGTDQLLADERGEARSQVPFLGSESLDRAAVEDLPFDRATLEDGALPAFELIEACGQQRLQAGRDDHLTLGLAGHGQHLGDEQRVTARRMCDLLAPIGGNRFGEQRVDGVLGERLEPKRARPVRTALAQIRARHAQKQDGRT